MGIGPRRAPGWTHTFGNRVLELEDLGAVEGSGRRVFGTPLKAAGAVASTAQEAARDAAAPGHQRRTRPSRSPRSRRGAGRPQSATQPWDDFPHTLCARTSPRRGCAGSLSPSSPGEGDDRRPPAQPRQRREEGFVFHIGFVGLAFAVEEDEQWPSPGMPFRHPGNAMSARVLPDRVAVNRQMDDSLEPCVSTRANLPSRRGPAR